MDGGASLCQSAANTTFVSGSSSRYPPMALTPKASRPSEQKHEREKETVYLLFQPNEPKPLCFRWFALNLNDGIVTNFNVGPASLKTPWTINANVSAVALGSVIYVLGGRCCSLSVCSAKIRGPHFHKDVYHFDTDRPNNGWQQAAPMNAGRNLPAVVAVDGKIYAIAGCPPNVHPKAEVYDPKTDLWEPLQDCPGFDPPLPPVQAALHIDDANQKRIVFQYERNRLHSFNLNDKTWTCIEQNFCGWWLNKGAVVDNILYYFSPDPRLRSQLVLGFDLINNVSLPVVFPTLDAFYTRAAATAAVLDQGNGKLCLSWHLPEPDVGQEIVCVSFKVKREMHQHKPVKLTAFEVTWKSFFLEADFFKNILIL